MQQKKTFYQNLWKATIVLFFLYFGLCAIFIFLAAYTTYYCPGGSNIPTKWQLPKHFTEATDKHTAPKYPMLENDDWQLPSFKTVKFPSRSKNVQISGWYTEVDKNAPVVIVTHGIKPNCKSAYPSLLASGMLVKGNLNVLSIDLQNYGESSKVSRFITYGQKEYLDVLGAYDWLKSQGYQANQIGLMGLSLGAVTSAIAFSQEESIQAIWLDSPFSDFNRMFCHELKSKYLPCFFKYGVNILAKTITHIPLDKIKTTDAISSKNNRFIFLTHGKQDKRIPFEHAEILLAEAKNKNAHIDIWFSEDSGHLEAMRIYPRLYQKQLVNFFNLHLKHKETAS